MAWNQKKKQEPAPVKNTEEFENEIRSCYDRSEFEALILDNESLFHQWESKIGSLLKNAPGGAITNEQMVQAFGLSINCVSRFRHEIPAKRRSVIMLSALLRLNVQQTNDLLSRWAKYQKLYAKHPEDAIWIYILNNGGTDRPRELFEAYWEVYTAIRREEMKKRGIHSSGIMETVLVEDHINRVRRADGVLPEEDEEFREMIRTCISAYEDGYRKLADYIEAQFIRVYEDQPGWMTSDEMSRLREQKKITPNILFQDDKSYRDRFYNRIRRIRRNHEVPKRAFLISIGVRLAMRTSQINYMLGLAGMQPLCAKDRLECALIFFLEELYLYYPSFFRADPLNQEDQGKGLRDCTLEELAELGDNAPMLQIDSLTEAPSERMMTYIKRCLEECGIFRNQEDLNEFLGLL